MSMNVKKGDAVKVIAGNDRGKSGQIIAVDPNSKRIVLKGDGLTMDTHFVKPRSAQEKGGLIKKERAIDASNVMIICPTCNKVTRVAHKIEKNEKDKNVNVRLCKKCGASLEVSQAKAKTAAKKATKTTKKASKKAVKE